MKNYNLKIAVLSGWSHEKLGGVENYCALCYQDWTPKYQIVEFPLLKTGLGNHQVRDKNPDVVIDDSLLGLKPHSLLWAKTYPQSLMKKIYENYDLVILNTSLPPRKWLHHPKSIFVQHMHNDWYSLGGKKMSVSIGQFLVSIFFGVGTLTNSFKKAANVVFFAKETKTPTKAKNVFFIPLAHKSRSEITWHQTSRQRFASIGRLENQQKNLIDLIKIANLNDDVVIYGAGHGLKMLRKKLVNFSQYQGLLSKNNLDNTIKAIKALIITSHYEGFPFVIVEALSNGTPVIAFDTFASLHFFAKSQAVFTVPKNNLQAFNEKIAWIRDLSAEEYQSISQNALAFARQYLTKELFWQKWNDVLYKVLDDNQKLI